MRSNWTYIVNEWILNFDNDIRGSYMRGSSVYLMVEARNILPPFRGKSKRRGQFLPYKYPADISLGNLQNWWSLNKCTVLVWLWVFSILLLLWVWQQVTWKASFDLQLTDSIRDKHNPIRTPRGMEYSTCFVLESLRKNGFGQVN